MCWRVCAAKNVDINRQLIPVSDASAMLGLMNALQQRFGPFAKLKNQMALPDEAAAKFFHLRRMMVSVEFDAGMTFAQMCANSHVQQRWDEYCQHMPPSTVPGGLWYQQVETALQWIRSPELADKPVVLMCEVQCVLSLYGKTRKKMHEIYKVHRADDDSALYADFKQIRTDRDRRKQCIQDGSTPELKYCRDNQAVALRSSVLDGGDGIQDLQECIEVARRYGSCDTLQLLLAQPTAYDIIYQVGFDMLSTAICSGENYKTKARTVQLLLDAKGDMDEWDEDGNTPIYLAAFNGAADVVRVLADCKAKLDAETTKSLTALNIAADKGYLGVVQVLVQSKADIENSESDGCTPLYMAAHNGHMDNVCLLVKSKANVNQGNNDHMTPLYMAAQNGHTDVVRVLLANKADVNASRFDCKTGLFMAALSGHLDVVQELVEHKADVNAAKDNGVTPIFVAAQDGHIDIVQLLIKSKAEVDSPREDGVTALIVAAYDGHYQIVQMLVAAKADVDTHADGGTALDAAEDYLEIVRFLKEVQTSKS